MGYKWAIPSYKRSDDAGTVDMLHRMGYDREDIIVSTQTLDDFEKYKKTQGEKAVIVYREGKNDSMNRNTLLKMFDAGTEFILADDDIKKLCRLSEDGKTLEEIKTKKEAEQYFEKMFELCRRNRAKIWAWYPVANAFFMKRTIDDKNILVGTIFGIIKDERYYFDEFFSLKGDFEISLRFIQDGFNAIRFNGFTCEAKHRSKGGCLEMRNNGENYMRYCELLRRYPLLIKPSARQEEVRYIGKIRHMAEKGIFD